MKYDLELDLPSSEIDLVLGPGELTNFENNFKIKWN